MSESQPEFTITPMRVQTIPACEYFYVSAETGMAGLKQTIDTLMPKLGAAAEAGRVLAGGPIFFRYVECCTDSFILECGYAVGVGTRPVGEAQVKHLEATRCASVVVIGALRYLGDAYRTLEQGMSEAGLVCADEGREVYAYFENPDSPNNVTIIQHTIRD